ncbi:CpaF family protein [Gorillibacterium sp. sgz5001074]|uniref:CpaF family protein n=1 Tax=Gorillibacterium sp. sgz5001074 TaxID=3446695 RepID=UPI003F67C59D
MTDEEIASLLRNTIASGFDYSQSLPDQELLERIEEAVFRFSRQTPLTAKRKEAVVRRIFHSFRGLDVLQPLLDDPTVTEIMVNSHEEIFYERSGGVYRSTVTFDAESRLEDLIQSIVSKVNRTVNESQPIVDARLADGSRIHVVLPPVSLKGPTLTIRKFPARPITMEDLIRFGAVTEEASEFLRTLVVGKYNLFISGGTGSGKTTFLNALSGWIPPHERVITIEDSAELQIKQIPNLVSLETRNANTEGRGEISIRDLIRASLRMRPNRIIVGEVRGAEALDMLQAMNTGHDGSLSTGHSNTAGDMMSRLETMVMSGADLPVEVIRKQIASAIDVIIHLSRMRDQTRKVTEISEVSGLYEGEIRLVPLFRFADDGDSGGRVKGQLRPTGHVLSDTRKLEQAGLLHKGEEAV